MGVDIRAQITSRAGDPGAKDVPVKGHGSFRLGNQSGQAEFRMQLRDVLEAADHLAVDGKVVEVSVLVYRADVPEQLANNN